MKLFSIHRHVSRRCYSSLTRSALEQRPSTKVFISRSLDPFLNLSIEHFLLQNSHPESTILFLYTNQPSVIIGRNQNPWLEVNLGLLKQKRSIGLGEVLLVRRRSGGGTVFHDEGNVNYSVIFPTAAFDRDKHAHTVVRALHSLGVDRARVNERHDIVLDTASKSEGSRPLKVSGSAYKLTRLRSLHHGTCLLSSPNIKDISKYLRSPAKPFIKARGVDSVSSPVSNVNVSNGAFERAVAAEFGKIYGQVDPIIVGEEDRKVPGIAKGLSEIQSLDWTYLQTPQFTFSSHKTAEDDRDRPALPEYLPNEFQITFTARNGSVQSIDTKVGGNRETLVLDRKIHEIDDWEAIPELKSGNASISSGWKWLNELFGQKSV